MQTLAAPLASFPSQPLAEILTLAQAAACAGYKDKKSFLRSARATGLRVIEINARVLRVDFREFHEWLGRRTA